jgi:hypothetical protein
LKDRGLEVTPRREIGEVEASERSGDLVALSLVIVSNLNNLLFFEDWVGSIFGK